MGQPRTGEQLIDPIIESLQGTAGRRGRLRLGVRQHPRPGRAVLLSEFENAMVAKADFLGRYAAAYVGSGKNAR